MLDPSLALMTKTNLRYSYHSSVYSALTVTFLAETGGVPASLAMMYNMFCALALASHAKTTLTDPGTIPASAVPTELQRKSDKLSMCSQCQTFKPPLSHHCRICNRCISRMDHHCPWMNNCIGSGNLKHFLLFLIYTWICSVLSLALLGWNYFFCASEDCTFTLVLVQLVRIMTCLSIGAFLFTSSMLMNVCYGLFSGIGTIDRLKKKANNELHLADEEQIPLKDVFGVAGYHTWLFPVDPIFEDFDRVMGYSTPQRLLREQMKENPQDDNYSLATSVKEYMRA
jgi:palmitoyltransferase ZDHHC3/7/25